MTSKYEASVKHAMGSWHRALHQSDRSDTGDISSASLAIQRRDLMNSVLLEGGTEKRSHTEASSSSPHNYEDFLARIRSYKSSTWFAKPEVISATHCARFGWVNVSSDKLQCPSCRNTLSHTPSNKSEVIEKMTDRDRGKDKSAEHLRSRLQSGHLSSCPWSTLHSPLSFLSPPRSSCMENVLDNVKKLLRDNWTQLAPLLSSPLLSSKPLSEPLLLLREEAPPVNVTSLLTVGENTSNKGNGCSGASSVGSGDACSVSGDGKGVTTSLLQSVVDLLPANSLLPKDHLPLLVFSLAVQCSLLGLEVRSEQILEEGQGDSTQSQSLLLRCPLCQLNTKYHLSSVTSPLELWRCHRNFCPHVSGYTPRPEEGGEASVMASSRAVPAGWVLALECLLVVCLGTEGARSVLGEENLHFCHLEGREGSGKRSSPSSQSGVKGDSELLHAGRCADRGEDQTPFSTYKRIKHMLDS